MLHSYPFRLGFLQQKNSLPITCTSCFTQIRSFHTCSCSLSIFPGYPQMVHTILVSMRKLSLSVPCGSRCWCSFRQPRYIADHIKLKYILVSFHRPKYEEFQKARLHNCFSQPLYTLNLLFLRSETCCSLSVQETVVAAICPGCPRTIPNDSPELKELLKVSMEKYNSESNDDFYYKGGEILSATV